jgi:hypothetical protein
MIVGPIVVTFLCRNLVLEARLVYLRNWGRTVGAALRGRPRFKLGLRGITASDPRIRFQPRAATGGRPYSMSRGSRLIVGVGFHI